MEISTSDFANMFVDGFADEMIKEEREAFDSKMNNVSDLDAPHYTDSEGNWKEAFLDEEDFTSEDDLPIDEESIEDYRQVQTFNDEVLYQIGEESYDVSHIEKAVEAYKDIGGFTDNLNRHLENLSEAEESFNKLQSLAYGQIDATLEYYASVMDNPRTNDTDYRTAINETRKLEAQKAAIEAEYSKSRELMNQKKREAESLKCLNMRNDLIYSHQWNEDDFKAICEYIQSNQINLKGEAVNTQLMLALRKAAAFDAQHNKAKVDSEQRTVKALRGSPITKPTVAPETDINELKRKRAAAKAASGELKQEDMFKYLAD